MKKVLLTMTVAAIVSVASADLTQWNLQGGVAYDQTGTAFLNNASTALTFLNVGDEFDGGTIDIAVLQGLNSIGGIFAVGVAPSFLGGAWGASGFTDDASAIGTGTLLIVNRAISALGEIAVGDYVGIATPAFDITERWPVGDPAPGLPEAYVLSDVTTNIEVVAIPEPATLGLMGIAGLGMFLARKKSRA